jgi:hypothetical protein
MVLGGGGEGGGGDGGGDGGGGDGGGGDEDAITITTTARPTAMSEPILSGLTCSA